MADARIYSISKYLTFVVFFLFSVMNSVRATNFMNMDIKVGERRVCFQYIITLKMNVTLNMFSFTIPVTQCVGQELDQEDIAFFSLSASYEGDGVKENHVVKAVSASVIDIITRIS